MNCFLYHIRMTEGMVGKAAAALASLLVLLSIWAGSAYLGASLLLSGIYKSDLSFPNILLFPVLVAGLAGGPYLAYRAWKILGTEYARPVAGSFTLGGLLVLSLAIPVLFGAIAECVYRGLGMLVMIASALVIGVIISAWVLFRIFLRGKPRG